MEEQIMLPQNLTILQIVVLCILLITFISTGIFLRYYIKSFMYEDDDVEVRIIKKSSIDKYYKH